VYWKERIFHQFQNDQLKDDKIMSPNRRIFKAISILFLGTSIYTSVSMATEPSRLDVQIVGERQQRWGDLESAMDDALDNKMLNCLKVIYDRDRVPPLSDAQVTEKYNQVIAFLQQPECLGKSRRVPDVARARGCVAPSTQMYLNALDAMRGGLGRGVFPSINSNQESIVLYVNVENIRHYTRTKELLAYVWTLINGHSNSDEVRLMKGNLLANLNYCIEDDGHMTCIAGITKRLVMSIEGYIRGVNLTTETPEPAEFCAAYLTERLSHLEEDDPLNFIAEGEVQDGFTLQDLVNRIFMERAKVKLRINRLYGAGSLKAVAAINEINRQLGGWINLYGQYGGVNPNPEQPIVLQNSVRDECMDLVESWNDWVKNRAASDWLGDEILDPRLSKIEDLWVTLQVGDDYFTNYLEALADVIEEYKITRGPRPASARRLEPVQAQPIFDVIYRNVATQILPNQQQNVQPSQQPSQTFRGASSIGSTWSMPYRTLFDPFGRYTAPQSKKAAKRAVRQQRRVDRQAAKKQKQDARQQRRAAKQEAKRQKQEARKQRRAAKQGVKKQKGMTKHWRHSIRRSAQRIRF
jgi:hypothetical protein